MSDQAWRNLAECAREGDTAFFPEDLPEGATRRMAEAAALRICTECPVRDACLLDALHTERTPDDVWGVRGGVTAYTRKELVAKIWNAWLGAPCRGCGRTLTADAVSDPDKRRRYAHHNAHGYCAACAKRRSQKAARANIDLFTTRRTA